MADKATQAGLFGGPASGVLADSEIESEVSSGWLISKESFDRASLEASGYDIRVGAKGVVGGEGREVDLRSEPIQLGPGAYCGVISQEKVKLPDHIVARIGSKRALSYDGVILLTGTVVDPGYEGHLLFGLYNASQRRVQIRQGRKICNIVFERLAKRADKPAPSDPSLKTGNFPDQFIDRMANMDVLPWMQISERVQEIEQITKDIIDLKAQYTDVLQPIRDLTKNVNNLTSDVASLAHETRGIAKDVEDLSRLSADNSRQISQLAGNVATLVGTVGGVQERTKGLEEGSKTNTEKLTALGLEFGRLRLGAWFLWGLVILVVGVFARDVLEYLLKQMK
jgi:deoxycytidine triphosphate deaminase